MKRILYLAIALMVLSAGAGLRAQGTGHTETIDSFVAPPGPIYPAAGPIMNQSGVIYGTTYEGGTTAECGYFDCGTVYQLTPPSSSGGAWTEATLYSFTDNGDGAGPITGVVTGAGGTLYGWNQGSVLFELTPPSSPGGAWTETSVYDFRGPPSDGGLPMGDLAIGQNGSLYGATQNGGTYNLGTVFELTPPASPGGMWTLNVLYSFHGDGDGINPGGGVVIGANGIIYGTTLSGGALGFGCVFGLELVSGVWEEKVLASMDSGLGNPMGLALGHNGVLYGQTRYSGIFKASPPAAGGSWTVQELSGNSWFTPLLSMTVRAGGAIYWTTPEGGTSTACGNSQGCGALYELLPPTSPGGPWTQVVLHNFTGQHGDGYQPNGSLVVTKNGAVYGTTYYGGDNFFGTVFRYTP